MQVLKEEIRNEILAVAENKFYSEGYKSTTTRSIADEVGISVSNLYLYYCNKEAVFSGVIDGFCKYFTNALEMFFDHNDKDNNKDADISFLLQKIITTDQKKFVIIMDKSQGTRYEGFKQHMINALAEHMKLQINTDLIKEELVIRIFAKNFIEGIIEIAKNYKDENWLKECIQALVSYHMNGMHPLM